MWRGAEVAVTDTGGDRATLPTELVLDFPDGLRATPGASSPSSMLVQASAAREMATY